MNDAFTPAQQKLLDRWVELSDEALVEAGHQSLSAVTRASVAFHAGYLCALFLVGPDALSLDVDHPSVKVLRRAAEVAHVDVALGLLYLERRLWDPTAMPSLSAMLARGHSMRNLASQDRR